MPTYAIGDIHGERTALDDLLRQVEPLLGPGDTIVLLGDYIDRGPDSRGRVERILALRSTTPANVIGLLGNHEDWMLRTRRDPTRHSWLLGMEAADDRELLGLGRRRDRRRGSRSRHEDRDGEGGASLRPAVRCMPPDHRRFFESLALWHHTADAVCTHGGFDPGAGPIERQPRNALNWGGDDSPADSSDDFAGPEPLVYGQWNNAEVDDAGRPRPRVAGRTIGIDTIAHGVLTAIRLPDRRVFQSARPST